MTDEFTIFPNIGLEKINEWNALQICYKGKELKQCNRKCVLAH